MDTILLIESIDDEISRRRAEYMKESPRFRAMGLNIHHCYAVTDSIYLERTTTLAPPSFDQMFQRIESKVLECTPNYILLHTGIAFHKYPDLIISILKKLKDKYPNISFGFQMKPSAEYLRSNPIFDEKAQTLSQLIFAR